MRFKTKLTLGFILVSMISMLGMGYLAYSSLNNSIIEHLRTDHLYEAQEASTEVERYIFDLQKSLQSFSQLSYLQDFSHPERQRQILRELSRGYDGIEDTYLINQQGTLVTRYSENDFDGERDFSSRDWFKAVVETKSYYVSEKSLVSDANHHPVVFVAQPIIANGQVIGVIAANISLNYLAHFFAKVHLTHAEIVMTDSGGRIIANYGDKKIEKNFDASQIRVPADSKDQGYIELETPKGDFLLVSAPVPGTRWQTYVVESEQTVFKELFFLFRKLLTAALLIIIVCLLTAFLISKRLGQSIAALVEGATHLSNQKFGYQIAHHTNDEIGYLIQTFNQMSARIQGLIDQLRPQAEAAKGTLEFGRDFVDYFLTGKWRMRTGQNNLARVGVNKVLQLMKLPNGALVFDRETKYEIYAEGMPDEFVAAICRYYAQRKPQADQMLFISPEEYSGIQFLPIDPTAVDRVLVVPLQVTGNFKAYFISVLPLSRNFLAEDQDMLENLIRISSLMVNTFRQEETNFKLAQLHHLIVNTIPEAIIAVALDGKITDINPAACKIFNLNPQAVLNRPVDEIFVNLDALNGRKCLLCNTINSSQEYQDVEVHYRVANREMSLLVSTYLLWDEDHKIVGALEVARDYTERKGLEEQIRRSEKLAVVGQLAAGLAHEIRNPLTSIKGFLQLITAHPERADSSYYEIMTDEVERMNKLINEFLLFTKPSAPKKGWVSLAKLGEESIHLVASRAMSKLVHMSYHGATELPVYVDAEQIKQVLVNLLINAVDAVKENGQIEIHAQEDSELIEITVADNGPGIPTDACERIFEPFYTGKDDGIGLGLSVTHRIIESHGGTISAGNQPDGGAIFTIRLPKNI